jgi:hypothetical protein
MKKIIIQIFTLLLMSHVYSQQLLLQSSTKVGCENEGITVTVYGVGFGDATIPAAFKNSKYIEIYKDGEKLFEEKIYSESTYSFTAQTSGKYTAKTYYIGTNTLTYQSYTETLAILSNSLDLTINKNPTALLTSSLPEQDFYGVKFICLKDSVTFTATPVECIDCKYSWGSNKITITQDDLRRVYPNKDSRLTITAKNGCSMGYYPTGIISPNFTINDNKYLDTLFNYTICKGGQVKLSAIRPSDGNSLLTFIYRWNNGISPDTIITKSGNYTLEMIPDNDNLKKECSISYHKPVKITVLEPSVNLNTNQKTLICSESGDTINIKATTDIFNYSKMGLKGTLDWIGATKLDSVSSFYTSGDKKKSFIDSVQSRISLKRIGDNGDNIGFDENSCVFTSKPLKINVFERKQKVSFDDIATSFIFNDTSMKYQIFQSGLPQKDTVIYIQGGCRDDVSFSLSNSFIGKWSDGNNLNNRKLISGDYSLTVSDQDNCRTKFLIGIAAKKPKFSIAQENDYIKLTTDMLYYSSVKWYLCNKDGGVSVIYGSDNELNKLTNVISGSNYSAIVTDDETNCTMKSDCIQFIQECKSLDVPSEFYCNSKSGNYTIKDINGYPYNCYWEAKVTQGADWLSTTSKGGALTDKIIFDVTENTTKNVRIGILDIAGKQIQITQEGINSGSLGLINETKVEYSIYPNPTENVIIVEGENLRNHEILVSNLIGNTVHRQSINDFKTELHLKQIVTTGVYIIYILNENQQVIGQKKIVLE